MEVSELLLLPPARSFREIIPNRSVNDAHANVAQDACGCVDKTQAADWPSRAMHPLSANVREFTCDAHGIISFTLLLTSKHEHSEANTDSIRWAGSVVFIYNASFSRHNTHTPTHSSFP